MKSTKAFRVRAGIVLLLAAGLAGTAAPARATPILGTAASFAVLGASTVTNTLATTIYGDVGAYPGTSITGAGTITLNGASAYQIGNSVAQGAAADAATAKATMSAVTPTTDLSGMVLGTGGTVGTLSPGVYSFSSSAQLTGALTLDFGSHPGTPFIFQISSTLTAASNAAITVLDGDANSAIFWDVGSSATLGTGTVFAGNIIAEDSISLNTGAKILCGRAIALTAAVTMQGNTISNNCSAYNASSGVSDYSSAGFNGAVPTAAVPEPTSALLFVSGLLGIAGLRRAHRPRSDG